MGVSQSALRHAILDPALAAPEGLSGPNGKPLGKRFAVYRNNVAAGLCDALETGFPVIRKLVGDEFFRAMAGVYFRAHPPASPLLMEFGREMPGFLAAFPPVAHLPYLPDVARLEIALREAYHAADAAPIGPGAIPPGAELMSARLGLAPALRLVRSRWPILGIWRANTEAAPPPKPAAEDVLIARPAFDPVPSLLPPGGADFLDALLRGASIGEAALAVGHGFDPAPALSLLLAQNAISTLVFGDAR